jgi:NADH-quinone oxidoreductase subunit K
LHTTVGSKNQISLYMTFVASFLSVSTTLFLFGILGIVLNRKNILIILMSVELMLLAVNINLVVFSVFLDDLLGQMFALLVLTVAAAESAIGLAILVAYYKVRNSIAVESTQMLRG